MNRSVRAIRSRLLSGSALAFLALAGAANAQSMPETTGAPSPNPARSAQARPGTTDAGVAEIVVTAQKRSENVQRVPIVITAVTQQALANTGVQTSQGLAAALPGLQLLNIAGSLTPRVRGVGSGFTAAGIEAPIATYVDDVYHGFGPDYVADFADVEQVALLKGPQGTLFGRNATGGVLQITTRQPRDHFQGSFETSLDNYLTSRSNLFLTGPVAPDVAASASLSYVHQENGYGTNFATGKDTYKLDDGFNARGKVRAHLGTGTTVNVVADYSTRKGTLATNFQVFPGYSSVFPVARPSRAWDVNNAIDSGSHFKGGGLSVRLDQELSFARLSSISAYRDGSINYVFTNVPSPVLTTRIPVGYKSRQFTQEFQLVSPSTNKFSWTLGAFYFYNRARVAFKILNYGSFIAPFEELSFPALQDSSSVAGFAQGTYKIGSTTRLTAGVRYTYDHKTFTGQTLGTFANGVVLTLADVRARKYSSKKPTWRLAVDHDLAPTVLVYASYNRGLKSGGFNTTLTTNPPFTPEQLDAYEAGIKSTLLGHRVRLNVGGFYYNYKNIQVGIFSGAAPVIVNAAAARNYGADVDLQARITSALTFTASANLLHSEFRSFPNAPFAIRKPRNEGATAVSGDATGNRLPFSPKLTYTAAVDYTVPTGSGDFAFNLTDSYNSGFFTEVDNVLRQRRYHFLDASVSWKAPNGNLGVRIYVNNLLDRPVVSQAVTSGNAYLADYTNPPRLIGATLTTKF